LKPESIASSGDAVQDFTFQGLAWLVYRTI
jgi:hypothetical protein